jgi:hypothetical protein
METRRFAIALISTHLGYYPVFRHDHETDAIKETARNQVASLADDDANATRYCREWGGLSQPARRRQRAGFAQGMRNWGAQMAKLTMPAEAAKALSVSERLLLLCVASEIDFRHAKIAEQVVTEVVGKGLIERDADGALALTDRGRAVLRAMLPDL